jgi:hypothetical protein
MLQPTERAVSDDTPKKPFAVIEGGGDDRRKTHYAESELSWALRDLAANMLRVIRGGGKAYELLGQTQRLIDAAASYRDANGHWPSGDTIQRILIHHSEDEELLAKAQSGSIPQSAIERWQADRKFDLMDARDAVIRGALQIVASKMIGQTVQASRGAEELNRGMSTAAQITKERRALREAEMREARAKEQKPAKPKKRKLTPPPKL